MQNFTAYAQQAIENLAQRHAISTDAVIHMFYAVNNGNGTMAQFNHPELGGSGQWMQGGMTMIGDMFNNALKAKVDALCNELANLLAGQQAMFVPSPEPSATYAATTNWWRDDLGMAAISGAQNNTRYAWFPATRRLAIETNGQVTLYDTLDHQISGVSQQQGSNDTLTFSSQYGTVLLQQLPLISGTGTMATPPSSPQPVTSNGVSNHDTLAAHEVFALLEQLAVLQQRGILTDEEFSRKKAELLQRL